MSSENEHETHNSISQLSNDQKFSHQSSVETGITTAKQYARRSILYNGSKPFNGNATLNQSNDANGINKKYYNKEIITNTLFPSEEQTHTQTISKKGDNHVQPHVPSNTYIHKHTINTDAMPQANEKNKGVIFKSVERNIAREQTAIAGEPSLRPKERTLWEGAVTQQTNQKNKGVFFKSVPKNIATESIIASTVIQTKLPQSSTAGNPSTTTTDSDMFVDNNQRQCVNHLPSTKKARIRDVNGSDEGPSCKRRLLTDCNIQTYDTTRYVDSGISPAYVDLGDCNQVCEFCKATFWYEERLKAYFKDQRARYHRCCGGGKVVLPTQQQPPDYIKQLFKNKQFLENIRAYNQMFSMTSFGAEVDESVNKKRGPYVFKISGQIYHWIGSLCPTEGHMPRFLQLYIYDTENEVRNRMHHFGGQDSGTLSSEIVERLITLLNEHNGLVKLFRTARDKCMENDVDDFRIRLYSMVGVRQYDLPTSETLGALVFESGPKSQTDYDVIIEVKSGIPQRINKLHPSYMSLQYPLLFFYGEPGFHPAMKLINLKQSESAKMRRLTMNMYYSYQLHDRFNLYGLLPRAGRLFQQYVVTAYCSIELNRIDYIRDKQNDIRNEYLSGLYDAITRGDRDGSDVGTRTILPASFTGGPRYMYSHYLDALAICRVHGNPQFFITFTCNVKWPEITRFMDKYPELTPADRADIVVRIFEMKVHAFVKLLKEERPFGRVTAVLYTIEFQKRGLPHCHTLLWVTTTTKIQTAEDIDQYISAELPNQKFDPHGFKVVSEMMMHGPCGLANSSAVCMQDGVCSKNFPKIYNEKSFFDKDGYVHYRRRNTGVYANKKEIKLDNSYVVPYNRSLCLTFHAHINVEYCGWTMLIKYLFKYISKGTDRIAAHITRGVGDPAPSTGKTKIQVDEIRNFIDARYICPHEACWRIFDFDIHSREPAVQILTVHLQNMQQITFRSADPLEAIVGDFVKKKTTLTEWLNFNSTSDEGRHLTYLNFPSEFVWYKTDKIWKNRANKSKPSIGRLTYIHPSLGELFYLRMLLCHQKGCKSFEDIKTINDNIYATYRATCEALGLLGDDKEWEIALEEAAFSASAAELRSLFAHILIFCEVSDPVNLWKKNWKHMTDDIPRRISESLHIRNLNVNGPDLQNYVLYELEIILNCCCKSVNDFGLPLPPQRLLEELKNKMLMEEKNYDRNMLMKERCIFVSKLNDKQKQIYNLIVGASISNQQELIFVYGHGGTGKTFLWRTIISTLRSEGKIVLAVASSGIASLLLPSGRTAHSRFKLPFDLTDESMCKIKKHTHLAELLTETDLIIWDEAPMNDRRCFETLDRTLRDILNAPDILFGGKSVMLGGDFRQTLPVKKGASKMEIIAASIVESQLWSHFKIFTLNENMRLQQTNSNKHDMKLIATFSSWLLDVGDGKVGESDKSDPHNVSWIKIPDTYCIPDDANGISELINFIYDKETLQRPTAEKLQEKVIVCPKNDTADLINSEVLAMVQNETTTYVSSDGATPFGNDGGETELLYPGEYLNTLDFSGLPPHQLKLKIGVPVMLLRNLNLIGGLCNGTRMIVTQLLTRVIEVQIITGTRVGEKVFIPRINLIHKEPNLPFIFKRKQFPVKVCYAMTINKSQGQSLHKIGIYLPEPVFGHGQLYVALSRATSPYGLKILIRQQEEHPQNTTKNIVYADFLSKIENTQV